MQKLLHPGVPKTPRIMSIPTVSQHSLQRLAAGKSVVDQLVEILAGMGTDSGYAELYSGTYEPVRYCVPLPGDGVSRTVSYSEARSLEHAELISGSATIGQRHGKPFMHCHSHWIAPDGENLGGHLWLETSPGADAPFASVYGIFGAEWQSDDDSETNMPVFTPYATKEKNMIDQVPDSARIRSVVARVLPNEDITEAIAQVCAENGFSQAVVRAGLGSLIGATFIDRVTGETRTVDGPGTEIISLQGHVRKEAGAYTGDLTCSLVDRHGVVHAGHLVPGKNPVAVTFELVIQEIL